MINFFFFFFFFLFALQIAAVINPALDKYFPADSGVRIISEPGCFYVASAYTLAVNIIGKKVIMKEQSASDGKS
jgi:ornithine decarboxylase